MCAATSSSAFGPVDLFFAGAGFGIAGAFLLARGLTTSPAQAARRIIQGQNSFARFDVRSAEDFADGRVGLYSLVAGFPVEAIAYAWSAHSGSQVARTTWTYVGLFASGAAAILIVWLVGRRLQPWLRNKWLIEFARIDDYGYRHEHPSGSELFRFGRILGFRPYQSEFGDHAAYARRVFGSDVRDSRQDHLARPEEFQPFVALDDEHGYIDRMPSSRWRLPWR